ncbi:MAG TPA: isoleucine--tRNA ligase [Conexibacter sp.]|jgi:isoleucyl-tRNA synthetase
MREPHRPVDRRPDFPQIEQRVLERWREERTFQQALAARENGPVFSFIEGPPTANGNPGSHHVLLRAFKDFYMRYRTMCGYNVPRKAGWDCHGLPVELEVEKQLGLDSKREIEAYGVARFNERCRESNDHYIAAWERFTERVGFWIDMEHAFQTGTPEYIESVWWSLHELWDRGLIYEGHKVVPYCPRCGTALSSHEVAMGYQETEDLTATVKLPVTERRGPLREGDALVIWTTQPWTLFANCAVAIEPDVRYVRARVQESGDVLVLAEERVEAILGSEGVEILDRFPGRTIVDARYEPPFDLLSDHGPRGHSVLAADHVTLDKGTGLVHTAMAFGEEDFVLCERHGIPLVNPVRTDGTYDERVTGWEGVFVGDATPRVIDELRAAGKLVEAAPFTHSYPHCWRCDSKLLYYAKESWYIATRDERHAMLRQNQRIDWRPGHVRDGRFGNWLQGNVDWALSRDRYWGTPLPIWECDAIGCDARHCVGSMDELRALAGALPRDLHRPYIDEVTWGCSVEGCGGQMRRVGATIDTWYDSACMPFAQFHYPFEGVEQFRAQFPPSFICEGIDQTRGWFYTSLAVSTLLFDEIPFQTAVCVGHVQDAKGHKMSKSRGNAVDPWDVLEQHGADAFRWYYLASQQPWAGYRFSADAVEESVKQVLMPLWSTYSFYVLYANIERFDARAASTAPPPSRRDELDRWALSRLQGVVAEMRERIDAFDAHGATQIALRWLDDLSNWYVRLSRPRFWDSETAAPALATLRECLLTTVKLLAPALPFACEELYENLVGGVNQTFRAEPKSVHLCDYPEPDAALVDTRLERDMRCAREAIELGRDARDRARLKVRQPLRRVIVCTPEKADRAAVERMSALICRELNVKAVEVVADPLALERPVVLPNLQRLGARCGRDMPEVAASLRSRDGDEALHALHEHGVLTVHVGDPGDLFDPPRTYALAENDLVVRHEPREGLALSSRAGGVGLGFVIALDTRVDDQLRRECLAREIVRAIQAERRACGVAVTDRIELRLAGSADLLAAARAHERYVARETLATAVVYDDCKGVGHTVDVDGDRLTVAVAVPA